MYIIAISQPHRLIDVAIFDHWSWNNTRDFCVLAAFWCALPLRLLSMCLARVSRILGVFFGRAVFSVPLLSLWGRITTSMSSRSLSH